MKVYVAKMRNGDYRVIEAVSYHEARKSMGFRAEEMRERNIKLVEYTAALLSYDARRQLFIYGTVSQPTIQQYVKGV